jgi:hypothetical protein
MLIEILSNEESGDQDDNEPDYKIYDMYIYCIEWYSK